MKESLLKRIAPTRFLLSLFAAVLGLCVNCRADTIGVIQQFDIPVPAPGIMRITSNSSGITVELPPGDVGTWLRDIRVPALPTHAVVTSATFSLIALTGTLIAPGDITGRSQAQLTFLGANSIGPDGGPDGPCTPPSCAPTIANVSVAYAVGLGPNCADFFYCFTAPVIGSFDLLSLGIPPSDLTRGFTIGESGAPSDVTSCCSNASVDEVLYPGFNSISDYGFTAAGPEIQESVVLNYTTVPEPATMLLLIPGLLALAAFRLKKARPQEIASSFGGERDAPDSRANGSIPNRSSQMGMLFRCCGRSILPSISRSLAPHTL
jgi:hypothetical protein